MKSVISLLSVLLLAAVANGVHLGSKRCTWGPAYWCQHVGTACECGSSAFCAQLWQRSSEQPVDSNPEECAFCKLLIADLEKQLVDNKTESEIRTAAEKACSLVPEQQLQQLCKSVVDAYLPEVLELIRQKLPPAKICAALSLCGSGKRDPKLTTTTTTKTVRRLKLGDSGLCDDCEKVLETVKQVLEQNGTAAEVEQLLKTEVCSQLGPLKDACDSMVDQYLPEVLVLLDNEIQPKQLCQLLGFCQSKQQPKFKSHPVMQLMLMQKSQQKPLGSIECQVCEALVKDARDLIRQNKTEQEIIDFLKQRVCALLPAEQDKCVQAVTQYAPIIFQLLASELDPETVCQALGACGKSMSVEKKQQQLQPRHLEQKPVASLVTGAANSKVSATPQCVLCEFVLYKVDQLVGENKTQEAVQSALEKVCSVLPSSLSTDCDAFVDKYTRVVMQLIANDVNPALVCTLLGLCAGDKVPPVQQQQLKQQPMLKAGVKAGVKSATVCDICQTIISYAKSMLKENSTEAEITQLIEKTCQFLPTAEQAACHSFIEQYAPYVIQLLMQDVEPQKICAALGLCSSSYLGSSSAGGSLRYRPYGTVQMSRRPVQ